MKPILTILVLFIVGLLTAQESFTFNYQLNYTNPEYIFNEKDETFASHFIPKKYSETNKNSLLYFLSLGVDSFGFSLLDGNKMIQIQAADLENNYITNALYHEYGMYPVNQIFEKIELEKLDWEPRTVLDKKCNHYHLKDRGNDASEETNFVFCIDESNEIDNVSFLFPEQEGQFIKGLVLAVSSYTNPEAENFYLSEIKEINSTIHFDLKGTLAQYQQRLDTEKKETVDVNISDPVAVDGVYDMAYMDYMETPSFCNFVGIYDLKFENQKASDIAVSFTSNMCNYTYYLKKGDEKKYKDFARKEIKSGTKNFVKSGFMTKNDAKILSDYLTKDIEALHEYSAAEIAAEKANRMGETEGEIITNTPIEITSEEVYGEPYDYTKYESSYKGMTPETTNLAVTNMLKEMPNLQKSVPAYCAKLDEILPNFTDANLTMHAKNYAGQICDMYLGEFDGGVWYKGTLDAIRAEQLYFENNRDSFSKKDQKLVNEFLNSLD